MACQNLLLMRSIESMLRPMQDDVNRVVEGMQGWTVGGGGGMIDAKRGKVGR